MLALLIPAIAGFIIYLNSYATLSPTQISQAKYGLQEEWQLGTVRSAIDENSYYHPFGVHDYNDTIYYKSSNYTSRFKECLKIAEYMIFNTELINAFVYYDELYDELKYPTIEQIFNEMNNATNEQKVTAAKHLRSQSIEIGVLPLCDTSYKKEKSNTSKLECIESKSIFGVTNVPYLNERDWNVSVYISAYLYQLLEVVEGKQLHQLQIFTAWTVVHETYHYKQIQLAYHYNELQTDNRYYGQLQIDRQMRIPCVQYHRLQKGEDVDAGYFGQYYALHENSKIFNQRTIFYSMVYMANIRRIKLIYDESNDNYYQNRYSIPSNGIYFVSYEWVDKVFENYQNGIAFKLRSLYDIIIDNKYGINEYFEYNGSQMNSTFLKYLDYCEIAQCKTLFVRIYKNFDPCTDVTRWYNPYSECPDKYFYTNMTQSAIDHTCLSIFSKELEMFQSATITYNYCQNITINGTRHIFIYI